MAIALSGGILLVIGAFGIWAEQLWLIPSLGPSLFLQIMTPAHQNARAKNTFLGHLLGLIIALAAVYLTGADAAPSATGTDLLTWPRVFASARAVAVLLGAQVALRLKHPPAAATALIVALGAVDPTWPGVAAVFMAILLLTVLGEMARRLSELKAAAEAEASTGAVR